MLNICESTVAELLKAISPISATFEFCVQRRLARSHRRLRVRLAGQPGLTMGADSPPLQRISALDKIKQLF
jgi:hypothetical protein